MEVWMLSGARFWGFCGWLCGVWMRRLEGCKGERNCWYKRKWGGLQLEVWKLWLEFGGEKLSYLFRVGRIDEFDLSWSPVWNKDLLDSHLPFLEIVEGNMSLLISTTYDHLCFGFWRFLFFHFFNMDLSVFNKFFLSLRVFEILVGFLASFDG